MPKAGIRLKLGTFTTGESNFFKPGGIVRDCFAFDLFQRLVKVAIKRHAFSFHWQIANSTYDGIGVINGNTITVDWGQSSAVIYQVGADGVLRGTWDNGHATEILTPR